MVLYWCSLIIIQINTKHKNTFCVLHGGAQKGITTFSPPTSPKYVNRFAWLLAYFKSVLFKCYHNRVTWFTCFKRRGQSQAVASFDVRKRKKLVVDFHQATPLEVSCKKSCSDSGDLKPWAVTRMQWPRFFFWATLHISFWRADILAQCGAAEDWTHEICQAEHCWTPPQLPVLCHQTTDKWNSATSERPYYALQFSLYHEIKLITPVLKNSKAVLLF